MPLCVPPWCRCEHYSCTVQYSTFFLFLQRNVKVSFVFWFCFHLLRRLFLFFDRKWSASKRTGLRLGKLSLVWVNGCVPFSDKVMGSRPDTTWCHIKLATPSCFHLEPKSCLNSKYRINVWAAGLLGKLRIEENDLNKNRFIKIVLSHLRLRT